MTPALWAFYRQPMADERMISAMHEPLIESMAVVIHTKINHPKTTLCVGCGDGTELRILRSLNFLPVGVTLNPEGVVERPLLVADMHCLPFRSSSFDGIFCKDTFEHALAPSIVLSEFCRVAQRWVALLLPDQTWAGSPHHPFILTKSQLSVMALKLGWKTLHTHGIAQQANDHAWGIDLYIMEPKDARR